MNAKVLILETRDHAERMAHVFMEISGFQRGFRQTHATCNVPTNPSAMLSQQSSTRVHIFPRRTTEAMESRESKNHPQKITT
jgi:hypothetical protein